MKNRLERCRSHVDERIFKWSSKTLWGYGVGHVQSDLVATLWFSYLLVFLEKVVGLNGVNAGLLLTIGQLTDGIATPLVGIGLDKLGLCKAHYGQRKSWHLMGTLLITISFPFIYSSPPGYDRNEQNWNETQMMFYYAVFIVIFQIAWASAQVSHLSLIPCLTCKDSARIQLTSLRNAFTLLSSIAVHGSLTYGLFLTSETDEIIITAENSTKNCSLAGDAEPVDQVTWEDRGVYQKLAIGAVGVGVLFQGVFFHFFVHEPDNAAVNPTEEIAYAAGHDDKRTSCDAGFRTHATETQNMTMMTSKSSLHLVNIKNAPVGIEVNAWSAWFKEPLFYLVATQYCLTRLIVNIIASYMPFYLQESLDLPKQYIAIVPLVQFIIGFLVSFAMKPLSKYIGKNGTYFLGCLLCIAGSITATILESHQKYLLFILPLFFGAGCATILVQSLAMTAALIGENTTTAAFVYGAMSLTDKIACGGAIMLVQTLSPCEEGMEPNGPCEENGCGLFYCRLLGYGIAAVALLAVLSNVVHWQRTKDEINSSSK